MNFNQNLISTFCFICLKIFYINATECHSCLKTCKTIDGKLDTTTCDCVSETNLTCSARNCYSKIELFPDEAMAIIQVSYVFLY